METLGRPKIGESDVNRGDRDPLARDVCPRTRHGDLKQANHGNTCHLMCSSVSLLSMGGAVHVGESRHDQPEQLGGQRGALVGGS